MIYELWISEEDAENTFSTPENIQDMKDRGLLGKEPKLVWSIEANSWNEAMIKYHKHMGWEPYKPMTDE